MNLLHGAILVLVLALSTPARGAEGPLLPHASPTDGEYVAVLRAPSGGLIQELFKAVPLGRTLQFILEAQCRLVTEQTGFNALDLNFLAIVGQGSASPTPLAVGYGKPLDLEKISQTIQAAGPQEGFDVTPSGDYLSLASQQYEVAFYRNGLVIAGARAPVEAAIGTLGPEATPTPDLLGQLAAATEKMTGLAIAIPASPGAFAVLPGLLASFIPPQIQGQIQTFAAASADGRFTVTLGFTSPEAAATYTGGFPALLETLKESTAGQVAAGSQGAAALGPMAPLDTTLISARLTEEFFNGLAPKLAIRQKGADVLLSVPRDWLEPVMTVSLFPMAGALLKIPGFSSLASGLGSPIPVASAPAKSERDQCRDIQAKIGAAIATYRQVKFLGPDLLVTPELLQKLVESGYLDAVPDDPGQGPGTTTNYFRVQEGNQVSCKVHGNLTGTIKGSGPPNR
jgi:hypothetical protein